MKISQNDLQHISEAATSRYQFAGLGRNRHTENKGQTSFPGSCLPKCKRIGRPNLCESRLQCPGGGDIVQRWKRYAFIMVRLSFCCGDNWLSSTGLMPLFNNSPREAQLDAAKRGAGGGIPTSPSISLNTPTVYIRGLFCGRYREEFKVQTWTRYMGAHSARI